MRISDTLHIARVGTTPMYILRESLTRDPTNPHGRILVAKLRVGSGVAGVEKSELDPTQVFGFIGYQFDLKCGRV